MDDGQPHGGSNDHRIYSSNPLCRHMGIPNNLAIPKGGISDVPLGRGRRIPVILRRTVGYCQMNLKKVGII